MKIADRVLENLNEKKTILIGESFVFEDEGIFEEYDVTVKEKKQSQGLTHCTVIGDEADITALEDYFIDKYRYDYKGTVRK